MVGETLIYHNTVGCLSVEDLVFVPKDNVESHVTTSQNCKLTLASYGHPSMGNNIRCQTTHITFVDVYHARLSYSMPVSVLSTDVPSCICMNHVKSLPLE